MKSVKATRLLEREKQILESRIREAGKFLDKMPMAVKDALRQVLLKLGIDEILAEKREPEALKKARLTPDEWKLFRAFYSTVHSLGEDKHKKHWIDSLLSPSKGRPHKSDPVVLGAANEYLNAPGRLSYKQLAIKRSGLKDPKQIARFAELIKKKVKTLRQSVPRSSSPSTGK